MEHVLAVLANGIKAVIGSGGYAGIILLMALESACIPLPSEVTMPFAGALTLAAIAAPRQPLSFHLVALSGAFGELLGATAAYWIGATAGRDFILKYGRYILLRKKDLYRSEQWFERRGALTVFVARLMPVVRTFISLPAGIGKMKFGPFVALSFCGSLLWCYLLTYAGVQFASHLDDLKRYFHGADAVVAALLIAAIAFWVWHHLRPEKEEVPQEAA